MTTCGAGKICLNKQAVLNTLEEYINTILIIA